MMDSILPYYRKGMKVANPFPEWHNVPWQRVRNFLVGVKSVMVCICMLAYGQTALAQSSARAPALRLSMDSQGLYLSTQVNVELPSSVDYALERGLAIQFLAKASVISPRWYWFNKNESQAVRRYKLSFLPLTRKWRLQIGGEQLSALSPGITFATKSAALAAMQRINQWEIAKAQDLSPDEVYTVEFSYELDTTSLPRPMQIGVIGENDWAISVRNSVRFVPRSLQ
jgi:hypothetical protein